VDARKTPFGIILGTGAALVVGVAVVATLVPAASVRFLLFAIALGGYAALVDDTAATLATAGLDYLVFNGFFENRLGELSWDGKTSLWHVLALGVAVAVGLGVRYGRTVRERIARAAEFAALLNPTKEELHDA
jgi:hypothetical protein